MTIIVPPEVRAALDESETYTDRAKEALGRVTDPRHVARLHAELSSAAALRALTLAILPVADRPPRNLGPTAHLNRVDL